jgi:hypothetical protein
MTLYFFYLIKFLKKAIIQIINRRNIELRKENSPHMTIFNEVKEKYKKKTNFNIIYMLKTLKDKLLL